MATQRFYSACGRLISAFMKGKIHHGDMCSCAVGTLCGGDSAWHYSLFNGSKIGVDRIEPTGYPPIEAFEIEKHFEGREYSAYQKCRWGEATLNKPNDTDGFKGLRNVFDYLVSIEDWKEEEKGSDIFELLEALN